MYKYNETLVSGTGGILTLTDVEWDTYDISLPLGSTVDFAGSNPLNPFPVAPGVSITITMVTTANTAHSLLVKVTDGAGLPLSDALVTLATTAAVSTKSAGPVGVGDQGQVYFGSLLATVYDLIATLSGYLSATASVTISGDTIEQVILAPGS